MPMHYGLLEAAFVIRRQSLNSCNKAFMSLSSCRDLKLLVGTADSYSAGWGAPGTMSFVPGALRLPRHRVLRFLGCLLRLCPWFACTSALSHCSLSPTLTCPHLSRSRVIPLHLLIHREGLPSCRITQTQSLSPGPPAQGSRLLARFAEKVN